MRIIERTNPINKSVLYVVQEEDYNNNNGFGLGQIQHQVLGQYRKVPFVDIRSFATLQEAKDFLYQYQNNLQPGERIVS